MTKQTMACEAYKSLRSDDTFVYVRDAAQIDELPQSLRRQLGELKKVMDLELYEGRKLARTTAEDVMSALDERGFYLQVPPPKQVLMGNDLLPR